MMRGWRYPVLALLVLTACSSKSQSEGEGPAAKAAQYRLANGKTVDCAALKALPPGQVLQHMANLTSDIGDGQAALETCLADGPHLCDRVWVGWGMIGGVSMAVVDGGAPPFAKRAQWFGDACKAMTPADQACLLLSRRIAGGQWSADDPCNEAVSRVRNAMGRAHLAYEAARKTP